MSFPSLLCSVLMCFTAYHIVLSTLPCYIWFCVWPFFFKPCFDFFFFLPCIVLTHLYIFPLHFSLLSLIVLFFLYRFGKPYFAVVYLSLCCCTLRSTSLCLAVGFQASLFILFHSFALFSFYKSYYTSPCVAKAVESYSQIVHVAHITITWAFCSMPGTKDVWITVV